MLLVQTRNFGREQKHITTGSSTIQGGPSRRLVISLKYTTLVVDMPSEVLVDLLIECGSVLLYQIEYYIVMVTCSFCKKYQTGILWILSVSGY